MLDIEMHNLLRRTDRAPWPNNIHFQRLFELSPLLSFSMI